MKNIQYINIFQFISRGFLASITSPYESTCLLNQISLYGTYPEIAIGLRQASGSVEPGEGWKWSTNQSIIYNNWYPAEPNNSPSSLSEDCGVVKINSNTLLWNDHSCFKLFPFLIQYPKKTNFTCYEKTYQFVSAPCSWEDAKISAENDGGYLAGISNSLENDCISSFLSQYNLVVNFWIGGFRQPNDDYYGWKWESDSSWEYSNWIDEPNHQPNNLKSCLQIAPSKRYSWYDGDCNEIAYYLVEFPSNQTEKGFYCNETQHRYELINTPKQWIEALEYSQIYG